MEIIDLKTWKRKEHFEFFASFENPFFGLVMDVDCTIAYEKAKADGHSFFASYLHKTLLAANVVEAFCYRYDGNEVIKYNEVNASATISRDDGTFGFSFIPFHSDFKTFEVLVKSEVDAVRSVDGMRLNEETNLKNVIHFSSIPWIKFSGLVHAIDNKVVDSVPKVSVGKVVRQNGKMIMPVSVTAHHGLVDGLHISQFHEKFQELLNN